MSNKRQNLYDDDEFFTTYSSMREDARAVNRTLEQPNMRALIPELNGDRVLDLGCGAGGLSRWLIDEGAGSVLGVDPSANMLSVAKESSMNDIEYRQSFVEELELPDGEFDLVVSSLMFHYVDDLQAVLHDVRSWLKRDGTLVFSIEHPMTTAIQGKQPGWLKDEDGKRIGWLVDDYAIEQERVSTWFIDNVVKYHRTLASIINMLIDSGLRIDRVSEGYENSVFEEGGPERIKQQMRPRILFIRAIAE